MFGYEHSEVYESRLWIENAFHQVCYEKLIEI